MYSLGIDIGSSSVKVSLLDIQSGKCVATATNPKTEAPITAVRKGWAEQSPDMWWIQILNGIAEITAAGYSMYEVGCIGITYQMHGLVAVGADGKPVRDSIIWCDSRAVELGREAFEAIGPDKCLDRLLGSPGNFTASKLAWVKRYEPKVFSRIKYFMLPGDYIAYKLSGKIATTETGLSEQTLWDFKKGCRADFVADYYGFSPDLIPFTVPSIGVQAVTNADTQALLGIPEGTPISYRAGDQPNNAFSLNVLRPGEIAATGGTSGVVYGVTDIPKADPYSRVNTFLHVNHTAEAPRLGVLLCINGTGILNSWIHRNVCPELSYPQMNELAATAPAGSDGLTILPFGNGAERVLEGRSVGAALGGVDLVRHSRAHILRATQEGIAFSFLYGIDVMRGLGLNPAVIRAGRANLFLSPLFRRTLATVCGSTIELLDTDGSLGAARGAALGAGYYKTPEEAFSTLAVVGREEPDPSWKAALDEAYSRWKNNLESILNQ